MARNQRHRFRVALLEGHPAMTMKAPHASATATASLPAAIAAGVPDQADHSTILRHPIAGWVETTLGLQHEDNDPKGKMGSDTSAPNFRGCL
jgi:hypothetical protein